MTILTFEPPDAQPSQMPTRYVPTPHGPSGHAGRKLGTGLVFAVAIGSVCCFAALSGGISISTGAVEMNLSGSLQQGLQISFAAISN